VRFRGFQPEDREELPVFEEDDMTGERLDPSSYVGYHNQEDAQEDAELTHVGYGTPAGEYLRRFWHGIAITSELADLPLPIRILGEDLVLFPLGRATPCCEFRRSMASTIKL
jgi:hypothetical protein